MISIHEWFVNGLISRSNFTADPPLLRMTLAAGLLTGTVKSVQGSRSDFQYQPLREKS